MKKFNLSFVIPVYNEEENISLLYFEIKEILTSLIKSGEASGYEVIFINDGSTDNTQEVLESLKKTEKQNLKAIQFRKNFGKAEAYKAGFDACSGDLIFTMDGDLQDNPKNIPDFLEKINQEYDLVIGWKYNRQDPITKTFPSRIFNKILRSSTGLDLHDFDNGYRCMKKEIIPHLDLYEGLYRYIPIFANSKGFKVGEVKVEHRERKFGKSKYGTSRLFKGFFDLITIKFLSSYLKRPLHLFGAIGGFFFSIGSIFALDFILLLLAGVALRQPLLTIAILLIIIGIQFILFGLIGEMITNISRKEKYYVIKKII